jgi:hypothetical protein
MLRADCLGTVVLIRTGVFWRVMTLRKSLHATHSLGRTDHRPGMRLLQILATRCGRLSISSS